MNNFSALYIFVKSFPGLLAWVERDLAGKDKSWLLIYRCQKDGIETRIETLIDGNKNDLYSVSLCCFTTAKAGQVILNAALFKGLIRQKRVPHFQKALHDGSTQLLNRSWPAVGIYPRLEAPFSITTPILAPQDTRASAGRALFCRQASSRRHTPCHRRHRFASCT